MRERVTSREGLRGEKNRDRKPIGTKKGERRGKTNIRKKKRGVTRVDSWQRWGCAYASLSKKDSLLHELGREGGVRWDTNVGAGLRAE